MSTCPNHSAIGSRLFKEMSSRPAFEPGPGGVATAYHDAVKTDTTTVSKTSRPEYKPKLETQSLHLMSGDTQSCTLIVLYFCIG